jgi:hypothetical protein
MIEVNVPFLQVLVVVWSNDTPAALGVLEDVVRTAHVMKLPARGKARMTSFGLRAGSRWLTKLRAATRESVR